MENTNKENHQNYGDFFIFVHKNTKITNNKLIRNLTKVFSNYNLYTKRKEGEIMNKFNKIIKKTLGFFVLLIVATFVGVFTINEIKPDINSELSGGKYFVDPDDEDYGVVGVFSYDSSESQSS
jgi:hypothetical protein